MDIRSRWSVIFNVNISCEAAGNIWLYVCKQINFPFLGFEVVQSLRDHQKSYVCIMYQKSGLLLFELCQEVGAPVSLE